VNASPSPALKLPPLFFPLENLCSFFASVLQSPTVFPCKSSIFWQSYGSLLLVSFSQFFLVFIPYLCMIHCRFPLVSGNLYPFTKPSKMFFRPTVIGFLRFASFKSSVLDSQKSLRSVLPPFFSRRPDASFYRERLLFLTPSCYLYRSLFFLPLV